MTENNKSKKPLVIKQKPMLRVIYVLIPVFLASVYFFGWRSLLVMAVVNVAGFLAEFLLCRSFKQQVSSAVFVTNMLFALSLPPTIPLWIAAVGIIFGVIFGKMVFGGFGKNVFNPAISGRAFIYISFGVPLTSAWVKPLNGGAAGFAAFQADAVAGATPLAALSGGDNVSVLNLLLGNTAGSYGETFALLILLCGIVLMVQKVASFRVIFGSLIGFGILQTIFWLAGIETAIHPLYACVSGSFLFGVMFNITDPISASQTTDLGRWIYGAFFGIMCSLIRTFSAWPEAVTFAVLLANMFGPILNYVIKQGQGKKKAKKAAPV